MRYNRFTMQVTIIENGEEKKLEPLTYVLQKTEKVTNSRTGQPDVFMTYKCEESGEPFYITEKTCEEFEKEGIIKVL